MADDTYDAHFKALKHFKSPKISEYLGKGAFGWVFKSENQFNSSFSAVKFIVPKHPLDVFVESTDDLSTSIRQEREQREFEISVGKRHKNILIVDDYNEQILLPGDISEYFGSCESDGTILKKLVDYCIAIASIEGSIKIRRLRMALCGKNLRQWLAHVQEEREISFLSNQKCGIVNGVINGLKYLHGRHLLHRDLKPENVCFSSSPPGEWLLPVKIADFGLSREMDDSQSEDDNGELSNCVGTPSYRAPEITSGNYTFQADLYSLGLVIWETFQPMVEAERRSLFMKLVDLGETSVVREMAEFPTAKELIVALTKANFAHRLGSIENVSLFEIRPEDIIFPRNSAQLQICLETQKEIMLAEVDYCGSFEVNFTGVTIKGLCQQSVIKCGRDIALEVSGGNCVLRDFNVSVEKQGVIGILVKGENNIFDNVTVSGGYLGCLVQGSRNNFNEFRTNSATNGIKVDGSRNIFNGIKMENMSSFGFQVNAGNVVVDNFVYSYGNSSHEATFQYGLTTSANSHNCEIRRSNCCTVKIKGKKHSLRDVDCGQIIEIVNISGDEHKLESCKGRICNTDGASISSIMGNNNFSFCSKGRDLLEKLKNCNSGDLIQLEEGYYIGGFVITKNNITLRGVGDGTIIACASHLSKIGLSIKANNCTILDLQFKTPYKETTGMSVTGSNNVIRNVYFLGGWTSIFIYGDSNLLSDARICCVNHKENMFHIGNRYGVINQAASNARIGVHIQGNANKIKNLRYNKIHKLRGLVTCGVFICNGTSNTIEDLSCDATHWDENTSGLLASDDTLCATISNCRLGRGKLSGRGHTLNNVECNLFLEILGPNHTLVNCSSNHFRTDRDQKAVTDCDFKTMELVESEGINVETLEKSLQTSITLKAESPQTNSHVGIKRIALDSEELKKCLFECNPGDSITLREGLYEGEFNLVQHSVTVRGAGKLLTILRSPVSLDKDSVRLHITGNNCTVCDLTFIVVGESGGLWLDSSGNTARNLAFLGGRYSLIIRGMNNKLSDINVDEANYGIVIRDGGDGNEIKNVEMNNVSNTGVWITNSCKTILKSARFYNSGCGIQVSGNENIFSDVTYLKASQGAKSIGVRILSGTGNTLQNLKCEGLKRWKLDYGLKIENQASNARISNSTCERAQIEGNGHNLKNVNFGVRLRVEGSGHHFEKCKALYVENCGEDLDLSGVDISEEVDYDVYM